MLSGDASEDRSDDLADPPNSLDLRGVTSADPRYDLVALSVAGNPRKAEGRGLYERESGHVVVELVIRRGHHTKALRTAASTPLVRPPR
ncbi:hypothetical protein BH18ACT14_BH18ACT14_14170 [soil metagenome]